MRLANYVVVLCFVGCQEKDSQSDQVEIVVSIPERSPSENELKVESLVLASFEKDDRSWRELERRLLNEGISVIATGSKGVRLVIPVNEKDIAQKIYDRYLGEIENGVRPKEE